MYCGGIGCVALALFVCSCSMMRPSRHEKAPSEEGAPPVRYSIVCIIHGDGDYLYHDTRGKEHRADEEALAAARTVAKQNPEAEVFIFHERPRKRLLWLFSLRHDGKCYYYRNGRLAAEESYRRDEGRERFEPEVKLHDRFRADGGAGR